MSLFAIVFIHGAWALRLANPIFSWYLGVGLPGGPNALLTVPGRSSGRLYGTPVAVLQVQDRRFVQAAFGEVSWVRNLRAAGRARLTKGRHTAFLDAVELSPEAAATIMRDALVPYRRSQLLRTVVEPTTRPPVGVLQYFRVQVDETLEAYIAEARRHPLFELLPNLLPPVEVRP